jgi:hypothetical protein
LREKPIRAEKKFRLYEKILVSFSILQVNLAEKSLFLPSASSSSSSTLSVDKLEKSLSLSPRK